MRTFTTEHTVYTFDELTDEAKEQALTNLADINVSYDWWDTTYEDASTIGLDITGFDLYRYECNGQLTDSLEYSIRAIMENHSKTCDTYQLAERYAPEYAKFAKLYDEGTDEFDDQYTDMTQEFLTELLEAYYKILQQECEYRTSDEAIIETIRDNEYEFTKEGVLA